MNINRYRKFLPVVVALVVLGGTALEKLGIDVSGITNNIPGLAGNQSGQNRGNSNGGNNNSGGSSHPTGEKWSSTNPEINLHHIFEGEINKRGKPTGYHSRPGGNDPSNARVKKVNDKPNRAGVYTAVIEVRDGNQWKSKNSSFFPDSMSRDEVIQMIANAYNNRKGGNGPKWSGPSGRGFTIDGYTTNQGGINTAYPIYRRNQ